MTRIGANIKKIRTAKGLSQLAFAELFDLSRGNISSYEENRAEPRLEMVLRIANHFCIPLEAFITRNLTINEILQFNGDKLLEEEHRLQQRQFRQVPFLSDTVFLKASYRELKFTELDLFPILILPEMNSHVLLAVSYQPNMAHHQAFSNYQSRDVLVFESVSADNIHLCVGKPGLFTSDQELILGKFEEEEERLLLVLNELRKVQVKPVSDAGFWKLVGVYQHIQ